MLQSQTTATAVAPQATPASPFAYPVTEKVNHIDTYFGKQIADPYRWLEDDTSRATGKWVEAQNALTFGYLEKIPYRAALKRRMEELYNYPKYSAPYRKKQYTLFSKNDGLQNQSVMYIQVKGGEPEVLLDPNKLSDDGTVQLAGSALSNDAKYWGFLLSSGGSDWREIRVMDLASRRILNDRLRWVKFSGIAWKGDGFYYSRYPAPDDTTKALSAKNEFHQVWFHKVGTDQSSDVLVYEDREHPLRYHSAEVTEDERYLIIAASEGTSGNALLAKDLSQKNAAFKTICPGFSADFDLVDNDGATLLVKTNHNAPNGRVVAIPFANPAEKAWKTLIAEQEEPLNYVSSAGGKLFANYSKDVKHRVVVFSKKGKRENDVELATLGTVSGFGGLSGDKTVFYSLTSFTFPTTIYEYDIAKKTSTLFRKSEVSFNSDDYETKQVFYPSKDGTKIPMFIVHKKGLNLNGQNPTLLYAYGGFQISLFPSFNPLLIPWLEQGGVYALANLRGGGEYGETWHKAGMLDKKQNVFDDFIAAAEYLVQERYTSPAKLAIQGGSNGGLLVGAVMTQRPELFKVALPAVGVLDMLRYHKFTIGWGWVVEYGSSDKEEDFNYLLKYSPLHNLKEGVNYPATLITTADHDDRVVPAHSFKFAATLQEKQSRAADANPTLIRVATKSGHGSSNTAKLIEERADVMSFTMWNLGMQPKF